MTTGNKYTDNSLTLNLLILLLTAGSLAFNFALLQLALGRPKRIFIQRLPPNLVEVVVRVQGVVPLAELGYILRRRGLIYEFYIFDFVESVWVLGAIIVVAG